MGNYRRRGPVVCFFFWFLMGFELCASLNHEGLVLLRFKDTIEDDPCHALMDWDEGNAGPCSWFGVECSDDGRVIGLNLANLGLKGVLPLEIGQLTHMHSLILHKNSFYGIIPTEIGDLWDLHVLDLAYNNFHGPIPPELLSLEFLFLKGNRFSGGLPLELNQLISHCESQVHQGRTPSNRMPTARSKENATIRRILASKQELSLKDEMLGAETSVLEPSDGNPFFAVSDPPPNPTPPVSRPKHALAPPNSPLAPPPSEPVPSPAHTVSPNKDHMPSQESKNEKRSSSKIYAFIGAAICFVVVTLSAAIFFCYRRRKTSIVVPLSPTGSSRHLQASNLGGITSFRRSELETACEGFSNVIGTLPGCTLYKGTLPCGAEIAVVSTLIKYSYRWSPIAEAEFKNKVEVLSQVNHKNFVNLVGYCEDEEPFTRMMVFEYVPNGSLFEHLHVKEAEQLNWQSRLRIAMGVIYCLNHMHQQNPPIILRNLNSSCIYLTEDNAAKVSDISFGGNKKEDEDEFNASNECTTVYKFALLLLESISGRRPFSDDSGLLILWAHRYLTGEKPLMGMVDSTLKAVPEEHVRALTELIIWCISDYPRQRPTLAAVTRRMQEITGFSQDQVIPRNSALWWAELEIITA